MNFTCFNLDKQIHISGLYTFFYLENDKTFRSAGEKHDFWELVYVDGGELYAIADNTGYVLNQGDVIFHKPMSFHLHASEKDKFNNIIIISFETQSPLMNFFANKIFSLNIQQKKILSDFLIYAKRIFGTFFLNQSTTQPKFTCEQRICYQICISQLERLLLELFIHDSYIDKTEKQSKHAKKIVETAFSDHIKDFLAENVEKPLSLDDICSHFNVSKSYLCQLFKNETGKSIIDYFIDKKISVAKTLIREGELNFSQIAEKLAYSGIHDFSRSFKNKTNLSPTQYRKSIKRD